MAFPRVNALSFWLLPVGGLTILSGYLTAGGAAAAGWTNYVPLALQEGTGEDLWILGPTRRGHQLAARSDQLHRDRAPAAGARHDDGPGAHLHLGDAEHVGPRRAGGAVAHRDADPCCSPTGTSARCSSIRPTAAAIANYLNTFWFFGHPEVYMLIMGAWGIMSEIIPVFSGKPLFGYRGVILALLLVMALSFTVWGHHMYTTGLVDDSFFSVTTELISVPTGVLFFNWLFTLWRGKIRFEPRDALRARLRRAVRDRRDRRRVDGLARDGLTRSTTPISSSRTSTTSSSAAASSGSWPRCTTGSPR